MSARYVGLNSAGREVAVRPIAHLIVGQRRVGFCCQAHYTVSLDWMAVNGELIRQGTACYAGSDIAQAIKAQRLIELQYSAEVLASRIQEAA